MDTTSYSSHRESSSRVSGFEQDVKITHDARQTPIHQKRSPDKNRNAAKTKRREKTKFPGMLALTAAQKVRKSYFHGDPENLNAGI